MFCPFVNFVYFFVRFFFSFFRCDSPEKLKALLPRLEQELKDSGKFKDFYQFTFNFAKNPGQKGLGKAAPTSSQSFISAALHRVPTMRRPFFVFGVDLEMAVAYWNLVLSERFKFLDLWNRFLLVSCGAGVQTATVKYSGYLCQG